MKHEQILEMMMQAIDGEQTPSEQIALKDHLAQCASCQAEWDQLQDLEQLLGDPVMVRPPTGFTRRVMIRVDRRRRVRQTVFGGLILTAGTAVAALLALVPSVWALSDAASVLVALSRVWDTLLTSLIGAANSMADSFWTVARGLLIPAVPLSLCGLTMTLFANLLWVGLVRRLQPVK